MGSEGGWWASPVEDITQFELLRRPVLLLRPFTCSRPFDSCASQTLWAVLQYESGASWIFEQSLEGESRVTWHHNRQTDEAHHRPPTITGHSDRYAFAASPPSAASIWREKNVSGFGVYVRLDDPDPWKLWSFFWLDDRIRSIMSLE